MAHDGLEGYDCEEREKGGVGVEAQQAADARAVLAERGIQQRLTRAGDERAHAADTGAELQPRRRDPMRSPPPLPRATAQAACPRRRRQRPSRGSAATAAQAVVSGRAAEGGRRM